MVPNESSEESYTGYISRSAQLVEVYRVQDSIRKRLKLFMYCKDNCTTDRSEL
jgi:hypothetical protein